MLEKTRVLLALAADYEAQGAHAQAAQCLAAAAADASELPVVLAQARLRLASLLLAHFDNAPEAKAALLTAEQELRQTQGHHLIKCEVWDALALANQRLGAMAGEADALASGLKACRAGANSKDREALARWQAYFHFKLAEHAMIHRGHEAAAEALQQLGGSGKASVPLNALERVLVLLCRATLQLHAGDPNGATATLGEVNPLLDGAAGADDTLFKQLTCHYSVLYVAVVTAAGRVSELKQDPQGNIQLLATLQQLLKEVAGQPWSYAWLPTRAVATVGFLLHASLLRSLGKAAPAAAYLAAAEEEIEQQLAAVGLDLAGSEGELSSQAMWDGRLWCQLRCLLAEQHVLVALLASRFAQAAEKLAWLTALLDRFPTFLARDFAPALHMLLGHYAHSLQLYPAASSHFRAALASDATLLHDPAALAAALAELHSDAGPAGMRAAAELLEDRQLTDQEHVLSLPVHDRAEALICNALRAQRGGDADKARLQLTKALKAAHAHLGNTQLVAQILNVLAPIQALKGDHAGAEQMLSSSTTLAKAQGDLPTLLASSRALQRLFGGAPGKGEQATKQQDYTERKAADLQAAIAAATALPCHAGLLTWRPAAA